MFITGNDMNIIILNRAFYCGNGLTDILYMVGSDISVKQMGKQDASVFLYRHRLPHGWNLTQKITIITNYHIRMRKKHICYDFFYFSQNSITCWMGALHTAKFYIEDYNSITI